MKHVDYIPTDEDHNAVEQWVIKQLYTILPPYEKPTTPVDWDKFNKAYERWVGYSRYTPKGEIKSFYQSKFFPWYLIKDDKVHQPNLMTFETEAAFNKFINSSRYLIHRCMVGDKQPSGKRFCAAYYHRSYGKVGWLKSKLQFLVNKLKKDNGFVKWFYDLERNQSKFKFQMSFQRVACDK